MMKWCHFHNSLTENVKNKANIEYFHAQSSRQFFWFKDYQSNFSILVFLVFLHNLHQVVSNIAAGSESAAFTHAVNTYTDIQSPWVCFVINFAGQTFEHGLKSVDLHSVVSLVPDNLLLRDSVEPLNVGDDDGHDEVDHDDGAEDDESHQQYHGEDLGQAWACILTAVPQIIELKLSWNIEKN